MFNQPLRLLDDHLGHLDVTRGRLIESRGNHLAVHRALHVGHLFGPLVDQQNDEIAFRMIGRDRMGYVLKQHRLAGARRCDDQSALALAKRRHQIDDPC